MGAELVGLIAVGTIIVEGAPGTPHAFTQLERDATHLAGFKAQQMLSRLAQSASPNHFLQCSFFNEWRNVVIDPGFISSPSNTTGNKALRDLEMQALEPQWATPAMTALGFPPVSGAAAPIDRYCDSLLQKDWRVPQKPRRGLVIFVTKFPAGWIAYASLGGNRATIQFDWAADTSGNFQGTGAGGYGIANLDRVIAHEMGHLFDGLDEYQGCNSVTMSGPLSTMNGNCVTFNPASVPCLMKENTEDLCLFSAAHLGWVDLDLDGVVDAAPPRVDSLFPDVGSPGDTISLHGFGLGETRSVVFTGVGAADFRIVTDRQLDVTVPFGSGAGIDVFVSTALGISSPSSVLQFSYL